MFKKLRFDEGTLPQKGDSEVEKMLSLMPKYCNCSACEEIREKAKNKLGKNKYNSIMSSLGILH